MADEFKSTAPKPFVFVLMPFAPEFDDIYNFGIKGAAEDAEAYAERIDEQIFAENILARMYNQINKADVLVADMTGRNANVFYEVGYAHALGKIVLLLTKNEEDIPFDLIHYPHIVYGGSITQLRGELYKKLIWAIAESKKLDDNKNTERISVSINGVTVSEIPIESNKPIIIYRYNSYHPVSLENISLYVSVYNMDSNHINSPLQLYLITECNEIQSTKRIFHPDMDKTYGGRTKIFDIGRINNIYSKNVEQICFNFSLEKVIFNTYKCHITIYSDYKTYIFPFIMEFEPLS